MIWLSLRCVMLLANILSIYPNFYLFNIKGLTKRIYTIFWLINSNNTSLRIKYLLSNMAITDKICDRHWNGKSLFFLCALGNDKNWVNTATESFVSFFFSYFFPFVLNIKVKNSWHKYIIEIGMKMSLIKSLDYI